MEDFNFYKLSFGLNNNLNIFGIFDGHKGSEIAEYLSINFIKIFQENQNFKEGKYEQSLRETFIEIDNSFRDENVINELLKLSKNNKNNLDDNLEKFSEIEKEEIESATSLFDPRNLVNSNISLFSGCTAIIVLSTDKKIFISNLGNCRAFALDYNGNILNNKTTLVHSIHDKNENKRVTAAIKFYENKEELDDYNINITRGFGDLNLKNITLLKPEEQIISPEPEIIEYSINEVQLLIVGSHGFFDEDYIMNKKNVKNISDKFNQKVGEYFLNEIKRKDKTYSKIIEDYFDKIIPKSIEENNHDKQSIPGLDNMTCLLIDYSRENKKGQALIEINDNCEVKKKNDIISF